MSGIDSGNDANANNSNSAPPADQELKNAQEKSLERMEALLKQSAQGIHVLFDNASIARILNGSADDRDFFDFQKMKVVQDVMTELVAKRSYYEKVDYLRGLDQESYSMVVRTYFHIVENTVRATHDFKH